MRAKQGVKHSTYCQVLLQRYWRSFLAVPTKLHGAARQRGRTLPGPGARTNGNTETQRHGEMRRRTEANGGERRHRRRDIHAHAHARARAHTHICYRAQPPALCLIAAAVAAAVLHAPRPPRNSRLLAAAVGHSRRLPSTKLTACPASRPNLCRCCQTQRERWCNRWALSGCERSTTAGVWGLIVAPEHCPCRRWHCAGRQRGAPARWANVHSYAAPVCSPACKHTCWCAQAFVFPCLPEIWT